MVIHGEITNFLSPRNSIGSKLLGDQRIPPPTIPEEPLPKINDQHLLPHLPNPLLNKKLSMAVSLERYERRRRSEEEGGQDGIQ